jgi:hypothetical protein
LSPLSTAQHELPFAGFCGNRRDAADPFPGQSSSRQKQPIAGAPTDRGAPDLAPQAPIETVFGQIDILYFYGII